MKKVIVIASVTLLFFLAGGVGMYLSVPRIFPERVAVSDSLAADSLADGLDVTPSLLLDAGMSLDSLFSDSLLADPSDSSAARVLGPVILALRDSLAQMRQLQAQLVVERDTALDRVRRLEAQLAEAIIPDGDAAELAKTLSGMNPKEIRPILERISDKALAALYHTATPRNKRTLMAAMPPERAVRLVQQQLAASEAPVPARELAPDSSAIQ